MRKRRNELNEKKVPFHDSNNLTHELEPWKIKSLYSSAWKALPIQCDSNKTLNARRTLLDQLTKHMWNKIHIFSLPKGSAHYLVFSVPPFLLPWSRYPQVSLFYVIISTFFISYYQLALLSINMSQINLTPLFSTPIYSILLNSTLPLQTINQYSFKKVNHLKFHQDLF